MTPLLLASSAGRFEVARLLIAHGADVNAQSLQGHSPLQYAASKARKEVIYFIIIIQILNINIID